MKKTVLSLILILSLSSSIFAEEIYQLGTIESMMKGYYESVKDIGDVRPFANMGLGTTTKLGGHVFDFVLIKGKVSIKSSYEMKLILPKTENFQKANLSSDTNDKGSDMIKAIESKE